MHVSSTFSFWCFNSCPEWLLSLFLSASLVYHVQVFCSASQTFRHLGHMFYVLMYVKQIHVHVYIFGC